MNTDNHDLKVECSIQSSFFHFGPVKITRGAKAATSDEEIENALKRHARCDFGEVSWEHHNGNLEFIEESRGTISSHYPVASGKRIIVMTRNDDFEPFTSIMLKGE